MGHLMDKILGGKSHKGHLKSRYIRYSHEMSDQTKIYLVKRLSKEVQSVINHREGL